MPFIRIPEFRLPSFHPSESPHSIKPESEGRGAEKPSSPMVKPGTNPFSLSSSSSGLSPSSNPMKSTMHNIKLPNDAGHYSVRDVSEQNGTYALYKRDPKTEAPSNTGKFVKPDGHGGWEVVPSGLRGGGKGVGMDDGQRPGPSKQLGGGDHSRQLRAELETLQTDRDKAKSKLFALNITLRELNNKVSPLEGELAQLAEKMRNSHYVSVADLQQRASLQTQVDTLHHQIDSTQYAIDATGRELGQIEGKIGNTQAQLKSFPS